MMFPITHMWFAEKVLGFRDSNVILGAIFPDIVISGSLDYKQTHYCGFPLYHYLKDGNPVFAKAMVTHTVDPMGLDYYGDESYQSGYKGYCFQKGQRIVDQVIEVCKIPESYGLWKAHNFIEMGIEMHVSEQNQYLLKALHEAFLDQEAIKTAGEQIEHYFGLKRNVILESFKGFSKFIEIEKMDSYTLAEKYDLQMQSKHNTFIDIEGAAEIIDFSKKIIIADIEEFFQYCHSNITRMLEGGDNHE